jgi:hypothetical protein
MVMKKNITIDLSGKSQKDIKRFLSLLFKINKVLEKKGLKVQIKEFSSK